MEQSLSNTVIDLILRLPSSDVIHLVQDMKNAYHIWHRLQPQYSSLKDQILVASVNDFSAKDLWLKYINLYKPKILPGLIPDPVPCNDYCKHQIGLDKSVEIYKYCGRIGRLSWIDLIVKDKLLLGYGFWNNNIGQHRKSQTGTNCTFYQHNYYQSVLDNKSQLLFLNLIWKRDKIVSRLIKNRISNLLTPIKHRSVKWNGNVDRKLHHWRFYSDNRNAINRHLPVQKYTKIPGQFNDRLRAGVIDKPIDGDWLILDRGESRHRRPLSYGTQVEIW